ncbi:hypothetical protein [Pseudomonas sp. NFX15]|uniref:hypothetical protein n=1 Tax=Pseudomonas sp. NFX15 TaxID=2816958 RepID=UPI003B8BC567
MRYSGFTRPKGDVPVSPQNGFRVDPGDVCSDHPEPRAFLINSLNWVKAQMTWPPKA